MATPKSREVKIWTIFCYCSFRCRWLDKMGMWCDLYGKPLEMGKWKGKNRPWRCDRCIRDDEIDGCDYLYLNDRDKYCPGWREDLKSGAIKQ